MKVLVDYDNVPVSVSRQGLIYLADRILTRISTATSPTENLDFRLYGGWDRNNQLTHQAQTLATQLRSQFPRILKPAGKPCHINMQLAESLDSIPGKRFPNTWRIEPARRLRSFMPSQVACRASTCPLDPIASFINTERCPTNGCAAKPNVLLSQEQQKIVDTLLVADLIHFAHSSPDPVALVSSDDDMWPGILSALRNGATVIHIQTGTFNQRSPYLTKTSGSYNPIGL